MDIITAEEATEFSRKANEIYENNVINEFIIKINNLIQKTAEGGSWGFTYNLSDIEYAFNRKILALLRCNGYDAKISSTKTEHPLYISWKEYGR